MKTLYKREMKYPLKTPELTEAKKAILKFLHSHDLDPRRDYSHHPTFGKEFRKLLWKLNKERDKIAMKYPLTDIKNLKKYIKMKKDKKAKKVAEKAAAVVSAKKAKKVNVTKEIPSEIPAKEIKKEKAPRATSGKYEYPLINGREMTSVEKKKYRAEQRKAASADNKEAASITKKEKVHKAESKEKKTKNEAPPAKKALKTKANKEGKKKKVKDED